MLAWKNWRRREALELHHLHLPQLVVQREALEEHAGVGRRRPGVLVLSGAGARRQRDMAQGTARRGELAPAANVAAWRHECRAGKAGPRAEYEQAQRESKAHHPGGRLAQRALGARPPGSR